MKSNFTTILLFALCFLVTSVFAKNFNSSREMFMLVSKVKKGTKAEALKAAKLLSGFKVHDFVVENLLLNIIKKSSTENEVRKFIVEAYIHQTKLAGHELQAIDNLAMLVGKFGEPDPIQEAISQFGPKTLPRLISLVKCPAKKSKSNKIFDPTIVANTIASIIEKGKQDENLKSYSKAMIQCMKCRQIPLALACSKIISNYKTLDKSDMIKIRSVLHSQKDFAVKMSAADTMAKHYKNNKEVSSLLKRSMKNKRAAVRLASTIAIFKHIDQSKKIKIVLQKFSKSKDEKLRSQAALVLKK